MLYNKEVVKVQQINFTGGTTMQFKELKKHIISDGYIVLSERKTGWSEPHNVEWVTHYMNKEGHKNHGHYFFDYEEAVNDYKKRIEND